MVDRLDRCSLIVNADDFGMSTGVNRGIIEAHSRGIVTSASLMVRWDAAVEAVRLSREYPRLGLGLHIDLGEWAYRDHHWASVYEVVPLNDQGKVAQEVTCQLDLFRMMTGRNPTHLDSHQHVHLEEPVRSTMIDVAQRNSIPLRHVSSIVKYCGAFYGQMKTGESNREAVTTAALIRVLEELSPGVTELCCHPGLDDGLQTMYCQERFDEVRALCDPQVRLAVRDLGIELCSFDDLASVSAAGDRRW